MQISHFAQRNSMQNTKNPLQRGSTCEKNPNNMNIRCKSNENMVLGMPYKNANLPVHTKMNKFNK